eukprot:12912353-Prorocentrum_lima.AAC.1
MYICDNPEDITITDRPGARCVHVLQLVQAPSGHLLLPCAEYSKFMKHKQVVDFAHSHHCDKMGPHQQC